MSTPPPRRFRWEIVYPPPRQKWFICPKTGYRMKGTAYRCRVPIVTSLVQVKEKSSERVLDVESEEDPKEDPQEDSEEEGEPKKKRLKEASESDSNTLPSDYAAPNKETGMDLDSTARCEAKSREFENTLMAPTRLSGASSDDANPNIVGIIAQQLQMIIPQIVTQLTNNVNNANANGNGNDANGGNQEGCTYKEFLACKPRDINGKGANDITSRVMLYLNAILTISSNVIAVLVVK
ncbi:hypothetical protein Tco_0178767 [Tanacetum coccineum]